MCRSLLQIVILSGTFAALTVASAWAQGGPPTATAEQAPRGPEHRESPFHYGEISEFFDIREACSNVEKGEWESETTRGPTGSALGERQGRRGRWA
jgi:hypothetical protein